MAQNSLSHRKISESSVVDSTQAEKISSASRITLHMKVFIGPSAPDHRRASVPAPARFSALSHMGFSQRHGVLKATF